MSDSREGLKTLKKTLCRWGKAWGMKVKSEGFRFDNQPIQTLGSNKPYKYLGIWFSLDTSWQKHLTRKRG